MRRFVLLAALAFGLVFSATRFSRRAGPTVLAVGPEVERLLTDSASVDALVGVYIGSSLCRWCRDPATVWNVRTVLDSIRAKGTRARQRVVLVGIDLAPEAGHGLDHLRSMGKFNQVALGGGALAEAARPFFWGEMAGPAATPQVVVFVRRQRLAGQASGTFAVAADEPHLLSRKAGVPELERWVRDGVPIPAYR